MLEFRENGTSLPLIIREHKGFPESMTQISFMKMHGAGNDFIVVDNRCAVFPLHDTGWMRRICHRNHGIGSEGILLLEQAADTDFSMRFFNPDGQEADMCGNGARCIAQRAYELGIVGREMVFTTKAGRIRAVIRQDFVTIQLPPPRDLRRNILLDDLRLTVDFIRTGVPHAAAYVDDVQAVPLATLGRAVRTHPQFAPEGVNLNVVQRINEHTLSVRTYERGVEAETPACGTGITASALLSSLRFHMTSPISVICAHGDTLSVSFSPDGAGGFISVELGGPVETVFEGTLTYTPPQDQAV